MTPRDYLARLEFHGIKLGLDNIRFLMGAAGDPHLCYPTLHVAGTNGKGSVVAFAASILRAAGYRVGRFTSPHLLDVNERFLIDGEPISDADLDRHIEYFRDRSHQLPNSPTYFELCTAVALRHFAERNVDVAVIEVGMGGRFDSTNVIQPLACAITNIAMDHMAYLGDTVEAIAFEKAGIIKPGIPIVVGERMPAPFDVIASVARECAAPLVLKGHDFTFSAKVSARLGGHAASSQTTGGMVHPGVSYRGPRVHIEGAPLGLAGVHQVENAALAIALIESIHEQLSVSNDAVVTGLNDVRWPCRLERVCDIPPIYIDIAHNPAAVQRLVESLPPCVVVFAASSDKNVGEMLQGLQPILCKLILAEFDGARATPVAQLSAAARTIEHETCATLHDAIDGGIKAASNRIPLLITGSIFTAGQARKYLISEYGATPLRF